MIKYINGDATKPNMLGNKIIAHVCNDIGKWGRGFVLSISAEYPQAEFAYRSWYAKNESFKLGEVQIVSVNTDTYVANMIGQQGIYAKNGVPPIRYEALARCLQKVQEHAINLNASVHMPRIGCGLAGGSWDIVESIIVNIFPSNVDVYVYDLA